MPDVCNACGGRNAQPQYKACETCRAEWRGAYEKKTIPMAEHKADIAKLVAAGNALKSAAFNTEMENTVTAHQNLKRAAVAWDAAVRGK